MIFGTYKAAVVLAALIVLAAAGLARPSSASAVLLEECSSGPRTLSKPGDRVYPDQGNGGYTSVHTDLHILYDTQANLFLPGNRADLTIRATQCLTDFSFDFERTAMSGSAAGPNMSVQSVLIDGQPATFDFRRPTYPGNPNGPDDPDPLAHAVSNANPVSATNPLPPACSPQTSGNSQNGLQCPANKLVITPATPIPAGTTITVAVSYTGRPGVHTDGDGSTEGWFRVNTTAAPNDGGFVTTEPVGSMAWMPLNNHPTAKPTYDVYDTVPVGKTAISAGTLETASLDPVLPTSMNPPDANFPNGSWTWHWHSPEPIANYLITNTIGSYDLTARVSPTSGIEYYTAMASGLTAARKATIKAVLDQQEDITRFHEQFVGVYPFTTAGVIVALPSVGFAEEMQTKITFGNGANSTPSLGTFHHEVFHQWFGDHVSEGGFNLTFWKEGWATVGEYLNTARNTANAAGAQGTPAWNAAFDNSLVGRFNTNYNTTSSTFWTSAPSNPTVGNLFSTASTYTRPGTAYLALRQILGGSVSRPESDRWLGAMRQILADYGGGSITQAQLQDVFHRWLPNRSEGCRVRLDQFFAQWFDTPYPSGGGANRPQITGPGLAGPGFYDDASACTRADQAISFGALANRAPSDPDFDLTATADSGLPVAYAADGPCTVTGRTLHLTGLGTCAITASQPGDGVFKPAAPVVQSFVVHAPVVSDDTGGSAAVQYSDPLAPIAVSATDGASPGPTLAATVGGLPAGLALTLDSTSPGSTVPGTRTWTIAGTVTAAPGSYPVEVVVTNDAGTTGSTSFTIEVLAEDAEATFGGETLVAAPAGGSTATVLLRAVVRDSAAVPGSGDSAPGDVRHTTVSFLEGGATVCGPVPVGVLGGAETVGSAACSATLGLGSHELEVAVGGRYAGTRAVRVDVLAPREGRTTANGSVLAAASAGTYRADPGSAIHVGLDVRFHDEVKGSAELAFDSGGRRYRVTSDTIDSLGGMLDGTNDRGCSSAPPDPLPDLWCTGATQVRATAALYDETKKKPVLVAGGLTLQLAVTDRRAPGGEDSAAVTLWSGDTLLFSSRWTGAATAEQALAGGGVRVG